MNADEEAFSKYSVIHEFTYLMNDGCLQWKGNMLEAKGQQEVHLNWDIQKTTWDDQLSSIVSVFLRTWSSKSAIENLISCCVDSQRAGHIEKLLFPIGIRDGGFATQDLMVAVCPDDFSLRVTLSLTH